MKSFRLHACREDGSLEAQMVELTWDSITRSESDEESMSFCFQYNRPDKPARWVKVYTPYVTRDISVYNLLFYIILRLSLLSPLARISCGLL